MKVYNVQCSLPEMKLLKALSEIPVSFFGHKEYSIEFRSGIATAGYRWTGSGGNYHDYTVAELQKIEGELSVKVDIPKQLIYLPKDIVFTVKKNGHWQSYISIYGTKKDNPGLKSRWSAKIPTYNLVPFQVCEV